MELIKEGFRFNSSEGYVECCNYNGSIVYCTEYECDEEGYETGKTYARMLTLNEIAQYLKDEDGKNHKVMWEDSDE